MYDPDKIAISNVARMYEQNYGSKSSPVRLGGDDDAIPYLHFYTSRIPDCELTPAVQAAFTQVSADMSGLQSVLRDKQAEADQLAETIAELRAGEDVDDGSELRSAAAFRQELERMIAYASGHGQDLALVLIQVGPSSDDENRGDGVLGGKHVQSIAQAIKAGTRSSDLPGRLDGALFGVVLMDSPLDRATGIAERIWSNINRQIAERPAQGVELSASFGLCRLDAGLGTDESIAEARADLRRRTTAPDGAG